MINMKGVELPINVLVIVAIAVIVLLGLVALYLAGFSPFSYIAGLEAVKNAACSQLNRGGGCSLDPAQIWVNYDANKDGGIDANETAVEDNTDTLDQLCTNFFNA